MPQTFVIKLGGSIVSPDEKVVFDFPYLDKLRQAILPNLNSGDKFFFVLGGGATMRRYRDLAMTNGLTEPEQLHWIGTTVNVLHGEIVRAYWHDIADDGVYKYDDYFNDTPVTFTKNIKVGGGGRPGHSGDVDAVRAAIKTGSDLIISLKNISAVFTADPKKDPSARPVAKLTWKEYLDIIGNPVEHAPGANYPIDPIAARESQQHGLKFVVINGWELHNLTDLLQGRDFKGTLIAG